MIENFWKSVEKWQELFMEVCNEKHECYPDWCGWFIGEVWSTCGYCKEKVLQKPAGIYCNDCPLFNNNICYRGTLCNYIIQKLRRACIENNYDDILIYTYQMLEAVSNPEYMKWFKKPRRRYH